MTLDSERVIIQAPMSYRGSAKRIWRKGGSVTGWARWTLVIPALLIVVAFAWAAVTVWYIVFGLLLVPYRVIRRGSRRRKLDEARHRERLAALKDG